LCSQTIAFELYCFRGPLLFLAALRIGLAMMSLAGFGQGNLVAITGLVALFSFPHLRFLHLHIFSRTSVF
jgi:hypothetical protein